MAVVMTTGAGGDEQQQQHQNPFFLDFLGMGMSSGGQTPAPGSRSMAGDAEPDAASPSASWQTLGVSTAGQHGIVPATSLLDSGPLSFMFGKEIVSERPDKARDDEIMLSMHRPPRPTSLVLHPPLSSRPDLSSKLEQSLSRSPGQLLHASCFSKATISSSYMNKDASAVATVISQSSIDEGSRTNIKASGVVSISNPVSVVCEKKSTEFLPRPKASHATESETSNAVRCVSFAMWLICFDKLSLNFDSSVSDEYDDINATKPVFVFDRPSTAASPGRQMTIFYSGQAHVFDNVHPNKVSLMLNILIFAVIYHNNLSVIECT
ncbi:hypothetical protein B296_00043089 [Ensete ventricosum]|uniref:Tify domain-containing protein n=1 Tax=Ensete ventricosum TaxID=4639 RepID=A0A426Z7D1_ENSVE|nr:hypothetical protein B296_00043089 [Ensete ventricosum]